MAKELSTVLSTKIFDHLAVDINTTALQAYAAGRITYDPDSLTVVADTGVTGVRVNIGQEEHYLVCNNSGAQIDNGKAVFASGVNGTTKCLEVSLADSSSFITSSQVLGLATHDIPDGTTGLVTFFGQVNDMNTSGLGVGGLVYLGTSGNLTTTKPLYPAQRIAIGTVIEDNATTGKFWVSTNMLTRKSATRSFSFNASNSGTNYVAGFYDFSSTDANLSQASTSITYGTAGSARAAAIHLRKRV